MCILALRVGMQRVARGLVICFLLYLIWRRLGSSCMVCIATKDLAACKFPLCLALPSQFVLLGIL